jgi:tetratricopeptide (TPR) repeat protein
LNLKDSKEAFKVFKTNYDKNPNQYTTNMGMTRGYSALGEYKKALTYAKAALTQAPDAGNKANVEAIIKKLEEGKDVN